VTGAAQPARGGTVRTLVDAVLLVLLVGLSVQIAFAAHRTAKRREQVQAIGAEAKALYAAFQSYRERNGVYPDEHARPPFDPVTFEPLRRRGYYHGAIDAFLLNGRVDGYDAPDDQGPDHEFWMEMTLASDPSVRILIARSDNAPSSRGTWIDGVFVWRDGKLEQL
jgi:hypothetical protein